jgi:hypothetical protein
MAPNKRSGLSLHRTTGMMVMIHRLRGRKPVIRVLSWSFSSWPRIRPENALLFGLFPALPRSCRGMPLGEPVRVRRVLCGVGVEAVLESCFHSYRRRPGWWGGLTPAEVRILPPPLVYIAGQSWTVASIHRIADKVCSRKPIYTLSDVYALGPVLRVDVSPENRFRPDILLTFG